jgi:hypothetical protein
MTDNNDDTEHDGPAIAVVDDLRDRIDELEDRLEDDTDHRRGFQ